MALPKETTTGEVICDKCGWLHPEGTPHYRRAEILGTCNMSEWGKTIPHPENPLCIKWKQTIMQTTYGNLLSNDRS